MFCCPKESSGFTLFELLTVTAILSVLSLITWGNFITAQQKGRDASRKTDLKQIAAALEAYSGEHGGYPASGTEGDEGRIMSCGNCSNAACGWGTTDAAYKEFCDLTGTVYMKELPDDPLKNSTVHYCYMSDGVSFKLYTNFENLKDAECLSRDINGNCTKVAPHTCAGTNWNYGLSSTNTTP